MFRDIDQEEKIVDESRKALLACQTKYLKLQKQVKSSNCTLPKHIKSVTHALLHIVNDCALVAFLVRARLYIPMQLHFLAQFCKLLLKL